MRGVGMVWVRFECVIGWVRLRYGMVKDGYIVP